MLKTGPHLLKKFNSTRGAERCIRRGLGKYEAIFFKFDRIEILYYQIFQLLTHWPLEKEMSILYIFYDTFNLNIFLASSNPPGALRWSYSIKLGPNFENKDPMLKKLLK